MKHFFILLITLSINTAFSQDFSPEVEIILSNPEQGASTDVTMNISQNDGEPAVFSIDVQSDGGYFDLSELAEDQVIGFGNSNYSYGGQDYTVGVEINVYALHDDYIDIIAIITETNDPDLPVGGIGGAYQMYNLENGGILVHTENPIWQEGSTSSDQTGSVTINDIFINPIAELITFTSSINQSPDSESIVVETTINLETPLVACFEAFNTQVDHDGDPSTNIAYVILDASCSEGDGLDCSWSVGGGRTGGCEIDLELIFGEYTYTLTVTDLYGNSDSKIDSFIVLPEPNLEPLLILSEYDYSLMIGSDEHTGDEETDLYGVTLDACDSYDPEGDSYIFNWAQSSGDEIDFSNGNCDLELSLPVSDSTYCFNLTLTDLYEEDEVKSDDICMLVSISNYPSLISPIDEIEDFEIAHDCNIDNDATGFSFEVVLSDEDSDTISYSVSLLELIQEGTCTPEFNLVTELHECVVDIDMNGHLFPAAEYTGNICVRDYLTDTDVYPEEFTDTNDNGIWDPEEEFIDENGNGIWDPYSNCLVFTVEVISAPDNNAPVFTSAFNEIYKTFDHNCPDADGNYFDDVEFTSVGVFDADGDSITIKWFLQDNAFPFCEGNSCSDEFSISTDTSYTVKVIATDCLESVVLDSFELTLNTPDNYDPINNPISNVYATADCITEVVEACLTGSAIDLDGDTLEYTWIDSIGNESEGATNCYELPEGDYSFTFTAVDCFGESDVDTVNVFVTPYSGEGYDFDLGNLPVEGELPHNGEPEGEMALGIGIEADTLLSYYWEQISGNLCDIQDSDESFTYVFCEEGDHEFRLDVTNECTQVTSDSIMVTVYPEPNSAPEVGDDEDLTFVVTVGCDVDTLKTEATLCAIAIDPEGDELTYIWNTGDETQCISRLVQDGNSLAYYAQDTYFANSDTVTLSITVEADNYPPVSSICVSHIDGDEVVDCDGEDVTVAPVHDDDPLTNDVVITLNGENSSDSEDCSLVYSFYENLDQNDGFYDLDTLCSGDGCLDDFGKPSFDDTLSTRLEPYKFVIEVTDPYGDGGEDSRDEIKVFVNEESNEIPESVASVVTTEDSLTTDTYSIYLERDTIPGGSVTVNLDGGLSSAGSGEEEDDLIYNWRYLEYYWDQISDDGTVETIHNEFVGDESQEDSLEVTSFSFEYPSNDLSGVCYNLLFRLEIEDNYGVESEDEIIVKVYPEPNTAPDADAGGEYTTQLPHDGIPGGVTESDTSNGMIVLTGSGSTDPDDPELLSYLWYDVDGDTVSTEVDFSLSGIGVGGHTYTLNVTDVYGANSSSEAFVIVAEEDNSAPISGISDETSGTSEHDGNPNLSVDLLLDASDSSDPENDTLSYAWYVGFDMISDGLDNVQATNLVVDSDDGNGSVTLTLKVTDNYGVESTSDVTFNVSENNFAPTINDDARSIDWTHDGSPGGNITGSDFVADQDGDTLGCIWTNSSGLILSNSCDGINNVGVDDDGLPVVSETFNLTVEDTYGIADSSSITFYYTEANVAPVANVACDSLDCSYQLAHDGLPGGELEITLDGSESTDFENDTLSYAWFSEDMDRDGGDNGETFTTFLGAGTYAFSLVVTDVYGESSEAESIEVIINPEDNSAPSDSLSGPAFVNAEHTGDPENDTASYILDASESTDSDSGIDEYGDELDDNLTFTWSQISGVAIDSIKSISTNGDSVLVCGVSVGTVEIMVLVTDPYGASSSSILQTEVRILNHAPEADILPGSDDSEMEVQIIHDNDPSTDDVTFNLNGRDSSDEDGDELEFSWKDSEGIEVCDTDSCSITIYDATGNYDFILKVTDTYNGTDSGTLVVKVLAEENNEPLVDAGEGEGEIANIEVAHDGDPDTDLQEYCITDWTATDEDGDSLECEWSQLDSDANQLPLPISNCNNYNTGNYNLSLTCADGYGAVSDSVTVNVIEESNTAPVAPNFGDINTNVTSDCDSLTNKEDFILSAVDVSDIDGDLLSHSWTLDGDEICETVICDTISLESGIYDVGYTVTDSYGAFDFSGYLINLAEEDDSWLNANAGEDTTDTVPTDCEIGGGVTVILSGSAQSEYCSDEDLSFEWKDDAGNTICLNSDCSVDLDLGDHTFSLTVIDGYGNVATDDVIFHINPEYYNTPVADIAEFADYQIPYDGDPDLLTSTAQVILDGCNSIDNDNCGLTYNWDVSGIGYESDSCVVVVDVHEGEHTVSLFVSTDYDSSVVVTESLTVLAEESVPPIVTAGSDFNEQLQTDCSVGGEMQFSVVGAGTSLSDLTYIWSGCGGDALFLEDIESTTLTGFAGEGNYCLQLTATDLFGLSNSDSVWVTISEEGHSAPIADAGDNMTIELEHDGDYGGSDTVTLCGSGSVDPTGCDESNPMTAPLNYQWYLNGVNAGGDECIDVEVNNVEEATCYQMIATNVYGDVSEPAEVCVSLSESNAAPFASVDITGNQIEDWLCGEDGLLDQVFLVTLSAAASYDVDGDSLTYGWSNGDTTETISLILELGDHSIDLCVYGPYFPDFEDDFNCKSTSFSVELINQVPEASAGDDQEYLMLLDCTVYDDVTWFTLNGSNSSDEEEECALSFSWASSDGTFSCEDMECTVEHAGELNETYTLTVCDTFGSCSSDDVNVVVSYDVENMTPTSMATGDTEGYENSVLTLIGECIDPEGCGDCSFEWFKEGELISIEETLEVITDEIPTNNPVELSYMLRVTDVYGASDDEEIIITVYNVNQIPIADAGNDQTLELIHDGDPETNTVNIVLDGSDSFDNDNDELIYQWSNEEGIIISESLNSELEITIESANDQIIENTYYLITDDQYGGISEPSEVSIMLLPEPNDIPSINSISYEESVLMGDYVNICVEAIDNDGDELTYLWDWEISSGPAIEAEILDNCLEFVAPETYYDFSINFELNVFDTYETNDTEEFQVLVSTSAMVVDYQLEEGFNLVSLYNLPEETDISSILCQMSDNANSIIGQGVASTNLGDCNWIGSLLEIEEVSGYWIDITNSDILTITGMRVSPDIEYNLYEINNLISYVGQDGLDISSAIPDDVENHFIGIISQGQATIQVSPSNWIGSLSQFNLGSGYWVIVDNVDGSHVDFSWEYSEDELGRSNNEEQINNPPLHLMVTQSTEQAFYFVENIELDNHSELYEGWLTAYCNNEVVGARYWTGESVDIPAMGQDDSEETSEYCKAGDIPEFKLFDESTGETIDLMVEDVPEWESNGIFLLGNMTMINTFLPTEFTLYPAYPNPFNPVTTINFGIPKDTEISLVVFDMLGRESAVLHNRFFKTGNHSIIWNAENQASGVYILRMTAGSEVITQKLLLMK